MSSRCSLLSISSASTLLFALMLILHSNTIASDQNNYSQTNVSITRMPLAFTENQGQWDEKVSFRANAGGATMWFASDGAYYQFTRTIKPADKFPDSTGARQEDRPPDLREMLSLSGRQTPSSALDVREMLSLSGRQTPSSALDVREMLSLGGRQTPSSAPNVTLSGVEGLYKPDSIETIMIKASFVGANANPIMRGVDMMEYKCNYFIGNDPNEWYIDVPNYSAVLYEEVYDGIDLKYYGNGKQMEYDFIVSPGADYSQIMIQYEGAESVSVNDNGELVIATKWGDVVEQRPVIYQIDNNSRIAVTGKYSMKGASAFSFEISDYNPALPLIIDPVLTYSTYLGGSYDDFGRAIAVDASGAAYITGYTVSPYFPTLNPYQNNGDLFIAKLSSAGNSLIYCTFLGGAGLEYSWGIAVDSFRTVYIIGQTRSTDFPVLNPYQGTFQGGRDDAFVTKLSSTGNSLVYSTYLGGNASDYGRDIAVDAAGSAYVTGQTASTNFPTFDPYQGTFQGGNSDAFVTKLSSTGNSLVYSTYLGGDASDYGYGIAVDTFGTAYVTGKTSSPDFPTLNPYTGTYHGGFEDAFVTKFSSEGSSLTYSTYLGGTGSDCGWGIAVDITGAAYVTGYTISTDFPTVNPYQGSHQGGGVDAFVTKLSSSGNSLIYSTYLGGSDKDYGFGIAIDDYGVSYITGRTTSTVFPTLNPYKGIHQVNAYSYDAFVAKLRSSGKSLIYINFLGGSYRDEAYDIAVDASGAAYITGATNSNDFPLLDPYQGIPQGGSDAFVTKFSESGCCHGLTGNIDQDPNEAIDVGDITLLIGYLFILPNTPPVCMEEANADGDSEVIIDIGDLTILIGYLFIPPNNPPSPCQ